MPEIMVRIEMQDFDAWFQVPYEFLKRRKDFGMTEGPVYRDVKNPNAALFHIHAEDLDRAMEWFKTDEFKEATKRAAVTGREFYVAEQQQR